MPLEFQKPTAGDDELLIRVHLVSLNLGEWELLTGDLLFIAVLATLFAPGPRYDPVPLTDDGAAASRTTGGGASTFAVQIAKLLGAEVTAVDSTIKLDMMRSIGADITGCGGWRRRRKWPNRVPATDT